GEEARGWLMEVMRCVESLGRREFALHDVYRFEEEHQRRGEDHDDVGGVRVREADREQRRHRDDRPVRGHVHLLAPGHGSTELAAIEVHECVEIGGGKPIGQRVERVLTLLRRWRWARDPRRRNRVRCLTDGAGFRSGLRHP
ncbi:MAG: hypothetical protein KDC38_20925, partial [Planctomycetes bacterium]|nr:hypothetical protein [Planctomycetota bacterium]